MEEGGARVGMINFIFSPSAVLCLKNIQSHSDGYAPSNFLQHALQKIKTFAYQDLVFVFCSNTKVLNGY